MLLRINDFDVDTSKDTYKGVHYWKKILPQAPRLLVLEYVGLEQRWKLHFMRRYKTPHYFVFCEADIITGSVSPFLLPTPEAVAAT